VPLPFAVTTTTNNNNINDNNKHAYAGQLNSFAHRRALLVFHDCGILAQATRVAGHFYSTTEVTKILVLRLGYYNSGTRCTCKY
jgi:hypothetical protein